MGWWVGGLVGGWVGGWVVVVGGGGWWWVVVGGGGWWWVVVGGGGWWWVVVGGGGWWWVVVGGGGWWWSVNWVRRFSVASCAVAMYLFMYASFSFIYWYMSLRSLSHTAAEPFSGVAPTLQCPTFSAHYCFVNGQLRAPNTALPWTTPSSIQERFRAPLYVVEPRTRFPGPDLWATPTRYQMRILPSIPSLLLRRHSLVKSPP